MKKFNIQQRFWLAGEYAERHQVDRQTAFATVNDVQRRGRRSPHYDDVMAPARERVDALKAGIAPVLIRVREQWKTFTDTMQPLVEWARTEQGQAQLAQWKREREEEARLESCHCVCQVSHGTLGVCVGEATRTLTKSTELLGRVDIPMCSPCADAALAKQESGS